MPTISISSSSSGDSDDTTTLTELMLSKSMNAAYSVQNSYDHSFKILGKMK